MTETLTLEVNESAARGLRAEADALGLTVAQLIEMLAEQLTDGGAGVYQLTPDQEDRLRHNLMEDAPTLTEEEVEAEVDRALGRKA